jgi:predicted metal-dependent hydrolase
MYAIAVRHPQFAMQAAISLDWLDGDALRSQYFNSMSMGRTS